MNKCLSQPRQLNLFPRVDHPRHGTPFTEPLLISGQPLMPTDLFPIYWHFAAERQNIFFRRLRAPHSKALTSDPILSEYKFTNAYRASDRVSQYLIRNVIYREDLPQAHDEVFFRTILFKLFNKIDTWTCLERYMGPLTLSTFSYDDYDRVLTEQLALGRPIYSSAYIMPAAQRPFGAKRKHQNHLRLMEFLLSRNYPQLIRATNSLKECYQVLLAIPSIGPFLAFQYAIDLNYSELTDFMESEFVAAGPGAIDGIAKCFVSTHTISPEQIILHMYSNQDRYFSYFDYKFLSLWGRPLQPIDCQNIFCEISKYARVAFPNIQGSSGRTRIKQRYRPGATPPLPWYPPKWGINGLIDHDNSIRRPHL